MRIAILPDLHITSEGKLSPFHLSDSEFHTFLENLSTEVDKIYSVGDSFDLWRARWLTAASQEIELRRIKAIYPKTMDFIMNNPKFGGIAVGNHDRYLLKHVQSPEWNGKLHEEIVLTNSLKQKIVLQHGHLDFFNRSLPWVGQMVTWASAWLERIFIRNSKIYRFLRTAAKSHVFRNGTQVEHLRNKINLDNMVVCLITGHTHKPQIMHFKHRSGPRTYINAGYFDGKVQDVTILDTETLAISKSPVHTEDYASVAYVVQKGDVILSNNRANLVSAAIRYTSDGEYSHSMAYIGNGQVIESTTKPENGVQVGYLENYLNGDYDICILRMRDTTKVEPFLQVLYSKLAIRYGYWQLVVNLIYLMVKKILRIDIRRNLTTPDGRITCSTLIAESVFQTMDSSIRPEIFTPQNIKGLTHLFDVVYLQRSRY